MSVFNGLFAQTPGSVSTGLSFWLKANAGATATGTTLTGWTNQSTAAIPVTVIGNPGVVGNGYNFNPYIDFNFSSSTTGNYLQIPDNNFQTFFWVAQLTNLSRIATHLATYDDVSNGSPCAGCPIHGGANGGTIAQYEESWYGRSAFQAAGVWRKNGNPVAYNTAHSGQYDIVSALGGTVVPTNVFMGGQLSTPSFNARIRDWIGPVGEIIAYSGSVTIAQANKIESYLAIKYGITLGGNASINTAYTSPTGAILWAQNTGYHYDVAGIGRDLVLEALDQPKSKSINTPNDVVSMANSSYTTPVPLSADGDYLIWGHDNGLITSFSPCQNFTHQGPATSITTTWGRTWRTQKTGNPTGNVVIEMDMNAFQGPSGMGTNTNADVRLLIDDNTAFNDASPGEYTYLANPGFVAQGGKLYFTVPYSSIQNGTGFFKLGTSSAIPTIAPEANVIVCAGTVLPVNTFTGSVAGTVFTWSNSNTATGLPANGTGNLPSFTGTNTTNAPIISVITVTPSLACQGTATSFSITINPAFTPSASIAASQTSICAGTPVSFTASPLYPGTNPNYQWLLNGLSVGSTTTFSSSSLQNGDVIVFTYTSNLTCATPSLVSSNTITITVLGTTPTMSAEPDLTFCAGSLVPLNTFTSNVPGTVFNWANSNTTIGLNANGTGDLPSFTALNTSGSPVTSVITVTPGVACPGATVSFSITVHPSIVPDVTITASDTSICAGSPVSFSATPVNAGSAPNYQWLVNGQVWGVNTTTFTFNPSGPMDAVCFTFTSSAACATPSVATANPINVYTYNIPTATFTFSPSEPTTENLLVQFFDLSPYATEWSWNFHSLSTSTSKDPGYLFPGEGTYSITLTVNNGPCFSTITHTLYIEQAMAYYIPNAFTPNGDGLNDEFSIAGVGIASEDFEMSIFDRWGTVIFKTTEIQKGWDGSHKGVPVSDDVYTYKIQLKLKLDNSHVYRAGHLYLLR